MSNSEVSNFVTGDFYWGCQTFRNLQNKKILHFQISFKAIHHKQLPPPPHMKKSIWVNKINYIEVLVWEYQDFCKQWIISKQFSGNLWGKTYNRSLKKKTILFFHLFQCLKFMTLQLNICRIWSENFNRLSNLTKLNGKFKNESSNRNLRVQKEATYTIQQRLSKWLYHGL